jgi:hypothetical protein
MSTHTIANTNYETFDQPNASDLTAGQIVQIPDGRAAEVLWVRDDNVTASVRPWDQCDERYVEVVTLEPYCEIEDCPQHSARFYAERMFRSLDPMAARFAKAQAL